MSIPVLDVAQRVAAGQRVIVVEPANRHSESGRALVDALEPAPVRVRRTHDLHLTLGNGGEARLVSTNPDSIRGMSADAVFYPVGLRIWGYVAPAAAYYPVVQPRGGDLIPY